MDLALAGVIDTSREDEGPAGTTVNSGAFEGLAGGCEGLAFDFARLGFSLIGEKLNLWGVPLKGL
jgi:hypothetical protein